MRLLVATAGTLTPCSGAAQVSISLARALCERGHDVASIGTGATPTCIRFWRARQWHIRRIEEALGQAGRLDAVDVPVTLASPRVAAAAPLVARSNQPELEYLRLERKANLAALTRAPLRAGAALAYSVALRRAILGGWQRARVILCLGSSERASMSERLPHLAGKLETYVVAPPPETQGALAAVRKRRRAAPPGARRFLWIGRYAEHKGIDALFDFVRARLAANGGDRFTLAGGGLPAEPPWVAELRRSGRLEVVPCFGRDELPALLERHDAGLFTSHVEGWGLSLQEMLESGLPVYATDAGAVPDLRRYFPTSLLPFPPRAGDDPPRSLEDLDATGYFQRFSWPSIAAAYEAVAARVTG